MSGLRGTARGPSGNRSRAALRAPALVGLLSGAVLVLASAGAGAPRTEATVAPAAVAGARAGAAAPLQAVADTVFRHARHASLACTTCHASDSVHGRITVTTRRDCRSCHHTPPVASDCAACHAASDAPGEAYLVTRAMELSVRPQPVRRELPFRHAPHEGLACASCHTEGLALSAADASCAACHEEHHEPDVSCLSCHARPPVSAHPVERAHVEGCGGAGCHADVPFEGLPRTRDFCEGCHQDMTDHRPGQSCAQCHQLPGAGGFEAATAGPVERGPAAPAAHAGLVAAGGAW